MQVAELMELARAMLPTKYRDRPGPLNTEEFMEVVGIESRMTITKAIKNGEIRPIPIGRTNNFSKSETVRVLAGEPIRE